MHVFYNVLDLALINSWILYKKVIESNISRAFIQQVGEELTDAELAREFVPTIGRSNSPSKKRRPCKFAKCRNRFTYDLRCLQKTDVRKVFNGEMQ